MGYSPQDCKESDILNETLSDPMDCSPPGSSVHGIFQARVPEWGAIVFSDVHPHTYIKQKFCGALVTGLMRQLLVWLFHSTACVRLLYILGVHSCGSLPVLLGGGHFKPPSTPDCFIIRTCQCNLQQTGLNLLPSSPHPRPCPFPTIRRSSQLHAPALGWTAQHMDWQGTQGWKPLCLSLPQTAKALKVLGAVAGAEDKLCRRTSRSEEHTSEL